jgi:phosphoglycerol transferase
MAKSGEVALENENASSNQQASRNKMLSYGLLAFVVVCLCFSETAAAYKNIMLSTKQMKQSFSMSSEKILEKLGAQDKQVTLDKVTAQARKNLVIIYCESLEANFLQNQNFTDEVPNLNNLLAQGWHNYTNYKCLDGADWTVGALYATQTGLPAYLGANSDTLFSGVRESGAVSYAGVLKQAGYKNLLLSNGDMNFAGTGNIMSCFGYEVKGHDKCPEGVKTVWGVHDYDLFRMAKEEYAKLAQGDKPFNLTLLTVDTHFPKGVPDKRMRPYVKATVPDGTHEFALASLDYLLGDFVEFIEAQPNGKETVIVILGDHLLMGDFRHTPIIKKFENKPRRVALLTNKANAFFGEAEELAYYDVPQIILNLAEVKHNAKFSKELFPQMGEQFVADNKELFTSLNLKLNGMR